MGSVLVELTILLTAARQQTAQVLTDRAILITGDSDQVPTISLVKENFPRKHITVVVPIGRSTDVLKETAHTVERCQRHLQRAQMPERVRALNAEYLLRLPPSEKPR